MIFRHLLNVLLGSLIYKQGYKRYSIYICGRNRVSKKKKKILQTAKSSTMKTIIHRQLILGRVHSLYFGFLENKNKESFSE